MKKISHGNDYSFTQAKLKQQVLPEINSVTVSNINNITLESWNVRRQRGNASQYKTMIERVAKWKKNIYC